MHKLIINKIYFLSLVLILFSNSYSISQTKKNTDRNIFETIGSDFQIALTDGYHILISPAKFSKKDLIITGGVLVSTAAIMPFDEDIRKYQRKNHSDINDKIMDAGKMYGNLLTPIVIGSGIYSYGLFFKDEKVRTTGRMLFESVAYAGAITTILKSVFGRSRPYTENGSHFYNAFQFQTESTSFPSGHSTVAFAISSVLSNRLHNVFASIGLYTLSGVTAISRVYHDDHWASDVFLGSAIGFFVGNFISNNSGELYQSKKMNINMYPTFNGMSCSINF